MSSRIIPIGGCVPRRGNAFSRCLGIFVLWLIGWRVRGTFPDTAKIMIIGAPHTSNFDAVLAVSTMLALRLKISFFVKDSAFAWPFGGLMRWFGAVPVRREDSQDLVGFSVQKFVEKKELLVAIMPEGTRHGTSNWKSGFYWIAQRAEVPVLMVGLDYGKKEIVMMQTLTPSGDLEADMATIVNSYRSIEPRRPERLSAPLKAVREAASENSSQTGSK